MEYSRFEASKEIVGLYLAGMIDEDTFNNSIVLLYKLWYNRILDSSENEKLITA